MKSNHHSRQLTRAGSHLTHRSRLPYLVVTQPFPSFAALLFFPTGVLWIELVLVPLAVPLPPKVLQLCRSKFFSLVADIAAKPWLSWSPKNSNSNSGSKGDGEGGAKWEALEAMWGLHEAWQGLEAGGRKPATGVKVGADEREACAVALAVVGRIREGEG